MGELPDFLIIPSRIIDDESLQPLDGLVYGLVYWYAKLKLQKCIASNEQIATLLHADNPRSVSNSLTRLKRGGYVDVVLNEKNQREEIIPLILFNKTEAKLIDTPSSNDEPPFIKSSTPLHQTMNPLSSNDEHNNIDLRRTSNNNINIISQKVLDYWNSKKIIVHRSATDKIKRSISGRIREGYTPGEITQAIDNYDLILKSDQYFWNYKWTLMDFLQRGFEKFRDLEIAKQNYKKGGQNGGYQNPNRAEKGKYSGIKYEGDK